MLNFDDNLKKSESERSNKKKTSLKLKIILLVFVLLFIFISEIYYRQPLFDMSLNLIKNIQYDVNNGGSRIALNFFKLVTKLGTVGATIPILVFFYLFSPLHITYRYLVILILASFLNNYLKMVYYDPRPFWVVDDPKLIHPYSCSASYGNPSGHSLNTTSIFLSVWWTICNHFKVLRKNGFLRMMLFLIFLVIIMLVMYSRLFLGVHTLNQLIFGFLLGICLFVLFHYIVDFENFNGHQFFSLFSNKIFIIIHTLIFVGLMTSLVLTLVLYNHDSYNEKYKEIIKRLCPHKKILEKFQNDGFMNSLCLCGLIGAYYGLVLLNLLLQRYYSNKFTDELKEHFLNWNKHLKLRHYFIKFIVVLCCSIPLLIYFIIPGNTDNTIVFAFKIAIPFFISLFLLFGPAIYISLKFKAINKKLLLEFRNIDKEDSLLENL